MDTEKLGKAIAKSNQDFLTALTSRGIVKSSPPKLHPFSGENHKEDVTFKQWNYEVRQYLKTHIEESVKEAMIQCLMVCHSRGCEESWGGLLSDSNSRALKMYLPYFHSL